MLDFLVLDKVNRLLTQVDSILPDCALLVPGSYLFSAQQSWTLKRVPAEKSAPPELVAILHKDDAVEVIPSLTVCRVFLSHRLSSL